MKLQYKSELLGVKSEKRYLLYRKDPSELSWWQRIFKNPWRYAYTAYDTAYSFDKNINDCLRFLFSAKEAHEVVEKYDTYEKLIDFLRAEYKKAKNNYYEAQEKYRENRWDF